MSIYSNLYPPIVPDSIPSFIYSTSCKIPFALSPYTDLNSIDQKAIQVTLINQKTNKSLLQYSTGIKFAELQIDNNSDNDYKYYIEITPEDLQSSYFEIDQFYKVQLRFTAKDEVNNENENTMENTMKWIEDNIDRFSEWSTVCLIKPISIPNISLNGLTSDNNFTSISNLTKIIGNIKFYDGQAIEKLDETEYLKNYNITIFSATEAGPMNITNKLFQSDEIYTNTYNPNTINYQLNYVFQESSTQDEYDFYTLEITCTTNNLYSFSKSFGFKIKKKELSNLLDATFIATPEEENGRIKLNINFNNLFKTNNNLIIKRTSSKTNFTQWEILTTLIHNRSIQQHLWYDTTIESGVFYKYLIQQDTVYGKTIQITQPIICVFEDIFLTTGNKQLKLQFNPTLSDFKYNVTESQQVTLGGKYPFIKRNGNNYFRSFSLGGLISALMDEQGWYDPNLKDGYFYHKNVIETFTTANQLYGKEIKPYYDTYNQTNNINHYDNDYIYEREFRQKVLDFLYENDIKLFRSLTQGNILVKLTNISLQPITALGRRLYSFSATAIEIDDILVNNLNKYNIINKNYYDYMTYTISGEFGGGESLINRFYAERPEDYKNGAVVLKLDMTINTPVEMTVYAKPLNNNKFIQYFTQDHKLTLYYSETDPIDECYFYGRKMQLDEYTLTNQYYKNTDDILNPIEGGVYYISIPGVYVVNRYVEYFNDSGILGTYQDETVKNNQKNYALLVQLQYHKMIYYQGQWLLFSENNEVLLDSVSANITYYYRIKRGT